jgi:hypothetical protein
MLSVWLRAQRNTPIVKSSGSVGTRLSLYDGRHHDSAVRNGPKERLYVIHRAHLDRNRKGDHNMFSLTSPNVTGTQLRNSSPRLSRRTTYSVKIIGAAAIALLGSAGTFANAAENSSRMALEQHACAIVMGLHQPGDLYDTCIRSLNKSSSELDQARVARHDRHACARNGLMPGTPAFAVCAVTAEQPPTNAGRHQAIAFVR